MVVTKSGWVRVLCAATAVGIIALISNITTWAQLSGQADTLLTVRFTLSKLVNSGTVWGGLLILAGWLMRRPVPAVAAAVVAGEVALVVHYGLGRLIEIAGPAGWVDIYGPSVWLDNWYWLVAPLIFGPPLALIGAASRRSTKSGLVAGLVVPLAAIVEPFFVGMFRLPGILPIPDRASSVVAGAILIVSGLAGGVLVLRHWWAKRSAPVLPAQSTAVASRGGNSALDFEPGTCPGSGIDHPDGRAG